MIVNFKSREFASRSPLLVNIQPTEYTFLDMGGCHRATLQASGSANAVWSLLNDLRCPVEIFDDNGVCVWWGYVHQVIINAGALNFDASLSSMANKVQVAYSYVEVGTNEVGQRKTTTAITDANSIAVYGTKQYVHSVGGMTPTEASALAYSKLEEMAFPKGGLSAGYGGQEITATVYCRGWWDTLFWQYADLDSEDISYHPTVNSNAYIGHGTTNGVKRGQQILTGADGLRILGVSQKCLKVGTPTDDLSVSIQANAAGDEPSGTALATVVISAGGSITTSYATYRADFAAPLDLEPNTVYWLVWERSGANNTSNYFMIGESSAAGYTSGLNKALTSSWVTSATDAWFTVHVSTEISVYLKRLIDTYGEFITLAEVESTTAIYTNPYQDGSKAAGEIIETLMQTRAADGRPFISWVDRNRQAYIYLEPLVTDVKYSMTTGGKVRRVSGDDIRPTQPPVGEWVRSGDIIPAVVDLGIISNDALQYIEESGYNGQPFYSFRSVSYSGGAAMGGRTLADATPPEAIAKAAQFSAAEGVATYEAIKWWVDANGNNCNAIRLRCSGDILEGEIVECSTTSGRIKQAAANSDQPVGAALENGYDGDYVWVGTHGLFRMLFKTGVTGTAGYVVYMSDTAGRANNSASIPAVTEHNREIGHVYKTGTSGSYALVLMTHAN